MKNEQKIDITVSEWEVMRVLWSHDKASSSEIVSILEEKMDWKPTTIKTLIARLVKKDLVSTEEDGNRYLYKPLVSEAESWHAASRELFGHICARKMGKKIASLINSATLSYEDIKLIADTLEKKRATAVEEVACDCIKGQCNCEPGTCSAS